MKVPKINTPVTLLFLTIIVYNLNGQDLNYSIGDSLYVFSINGLNVREQPNMNSKILTKLEFGEKIEVRSISENPDKNRETIDNILGSWIAISYNDIIGFSFDGYLSKLQIDKQNLKSSAYKYYDSGEEDSYEGHQIEPEIEKYIDMYYSPFCDPIEYFEPQIGKGGQRLVITKYNNDLTKIIDTGWEGYSIILIFDNTRLSEIKNLILYLIKKAVVYENTYTEIEKSLRSLNEDKNYHEILSLDMFWIYIVKYEKENKWAIIFSIAEL